jgi:hypothetical protein
MGSQEKGKVHRPSKQCTSATKIMDFFNYVIFGKKYLRQNVAEMYHYAQQNKNSKGTYFIKDQG